jgi:hypothetical protein
LFNSDDGYDFGAAFNEEQQREVAAAVLGEFEGDQAMIDTAALCGTDLRGYVTTEGPGLASTKALSTRPTPRCPTTGFRPGSSGT